MESEEAILEEEIKYSELDDSSEEEVPEEEGSIENSSENN
jgi:hypothetical protein